MVNNGLKAKIGKNRDIILFFYYEGEFCKKWMRLSRYHCQWTSTDLRSQPLLHSWSSPPHSALATLAFQLPSLEASAPSLEFPSSMFVITGSFSSLRFRIGYLLLPGVFSNHTIPKVPPALVEFLCMPAFIATGNGFVIYIHECHLPLLISIWYTWKQGPGLTCYL